MTNIKRNKREGSSYSLEDETFINDKNIIIKMKKGISK